MLNKQDPERAFLLRVSYIEIYNETLRDLLNFKKGPLKDDEKPNIHFNKVSVSSPERRDCTDVDRAKYMWTLWWRRSSRLRKTSWIYWNGETLNGKLERPTGWVLLPLKSDV